MAAIAMPSTVEENFTNDNSNLETISATGMVPKDRLSCPIRAKSLYWNLIESNRERARKDCMIKGQIDGNAPFNPARLRSNGEGWRANFNTLEAKATSSGAMVPYYDLFSGAQYHIDVQCDYGRPEDREDFNKIINEELDFTVRQWSAFYTHWWAMIYDYVNFGRAFPMYEDRIAGHWRFRHVPQWRVMVPDGTEITDFDDGLDFVVVQQRFTIPRLYGKIRNEDSARDLGWKPEFVKDALSQAVPQGDRDSQDPLLVQQRLKDNDLYYEARDASVMVGNFYIREFDGTITHGIVPRESYGHGDKEDPAQWLFYKRGRFKSFREAISPFFFEVADNSWHGASGLGKDIFAPMATKDRARMAQIDAHFMSRCLMLQAKTPSAMQNAALSMIGNCLLIPPEVEVQQASILADLGSSIAFNADLDQMISSNTGVYRPRMEKPQGNPETATQATIRAQQNTVLGTSSVDRFCLQGDGLYTELYRRISSPNINGKDEQSNAALEFQKRCMDRGVPRLAMLKTKCVRMARVIGNGSVVARQQAYAALFGVIDRLPQGGQEKLVDDLISVETSPSNVLRYNPKPQQDRTAAEQRRTALLENGVMINGAPVEVVPSDNNLIHAQTHLVAMSQGAASLKQGGDPHGVYQFLHTAGPHVAGHIQALGNDPARKAIVDPLTKQLTRLGKIADQLGKQLQDASQKQRQAQAISSGMDPDTQLKAAELQAKTQMAQQKVNAGLQLKQQKQDATLEMDRQKHVTTLEQEAQRHAQDLALEDSSTANDIILKQAAAATNGTPK